MDTLDTLITLELNVDDNDSEEQNVTGYATLFNTDVFKFYEVLRLDKGAFSERLNDDVRFQFDHTGMTYARTTSHKYKLQLSEDDNGLAVKARLADTREGTDLYLSIKDGLITEMSIGFSFLLEDADFGLYKGANEEWQGYPFYEVHKIYKLKDVSAVSFPAMEGTEIKAQLNAGGFKDQMKQITPIKEGQNDSDASNPKNKKSLTDNELIVVEKGDLILPGRRDIPKGLLANV